MQKTLVQDLQQRVLFRILTGFPFKSPETFIASQFTLEHDGDTIATAKVQIIIELQTDVIVKKAMTSNSMRNYGEITVT